MSNIELIKKLRENSGCGMSDCNEALKNANWDIEVAFELLRKKGLASASKKAGRETSEGVVGIIVKGNEAAILEVNSETDFVAKNTKFQDFANILLQSSLNVKSLDELLKFKLNSGIVVEDELKTQISVIGENLSISRLEKIHCNGVISSYLHNKFSDSLGKIGVLVAIDTNSKDDRIAEFGRKIAMHIAAAKPKFLSIANVDKALVEKEREIYKEQITGKPANVIEKIVDGKIGKYFEEVVLLEQIFMIDGKSKILDLIVQLEKDVGAKISIVDFKLFVLGVK